MTTLDPNPFDALSNPPASAEVLALRHQVSDLQTQLATQAARQTATTGSGLVNLISNLLPPELRDGEIMVDEDDDGDLVITIQGVRVDEYGNLVGREITFEVEGTITIPVSFSVTATSEYEADEIAADILRDVADDVGGNGFYAHHDNLVDEVEAGYAESDVVRIREA